MPVVPSTILFTIGGYKVSASEISTKICASVEKLRASPAIVSANSDERAQLLQALE